MKSDNTEIILVVDDHEINRYTTRRFLIDAGFQVIEASSGQEAIARTHTIPDLILLDVNLPDIDGFEVCRQIRRNPTTSEIPIVHTSATFVSDNDRVQGLDTGADGYLTRPIEPRVMVATIRSCLRARRAEEVLKTRETEFRSLINNSPDLIARFDLSLRYLLANRSLELAMNVNASDILGKTHHEVGVYQDISDELEAALKATIESKKQGYFDFWLEDEEIRRRFSSTLTPEFGSDGNVQSLLMVARDNTAQYLAENEREKFVTLIEHSRDLIGIFDPLGKPLYLNQAGLHLLGLKSLEDVRKSRMEHFLRPEDIEEFHLHFLPMVMRNSHGEWEVQIRNAETGLTHWINTSLVVLRDQQGRLDGYTTICREISEQKRLEEKLRQVASDLSDANRKKNEFLATLAHELRNPMAPIRTGLEVLKLNLDDREASRTTLAMMERQAHQMIRLIDDLLDLSRITQGKLNLKQVTVSLSDVLESAVDAIRPSILEAGHTLHLSIDDAQIKVDGDPNRLAQVFTNILSNASKYTKCKGEIWLSMSQEKGQAVVSIRDNGLGIPRDMQQKIFEMFSQIERPIELGYTGLGIGLTLVKRIVEMHNGVVSVHSDGIDSGSEFLVCLPLTSRSQKSELTPLSCERRKVKFKVLLVDDNRDAAKLMGIILRSLGNEVQLAYDGKEAIEAASSFRPSVIIMDLGMPTMNGYQAAEYIRSQSWGANIVLIALTGWGQEEDKQRTRDSGYDYHLTKPVEPSAVQRLFELIAAEKVRGVEVLP